jgi:hypothetical protein
MSSRERREGAPDRLASRSVGSREQQRQQTPQQQTPPQQAQPPQQARPPQQAQPPQGEGSEDIGSAAAHVTIGPQALVVTLDVFIKVASGLRIKELPKMAAVCQGFAVACRDDFAWKARCTRRSFEFRTAAEMRVLGGWRALYRERSTLLARVPKRGQPSMEAITGDLVEVESGVRCLSVSGSLIVAGLNTGELVIYRAPFEGTASGGRRRPGWETLSEPTRVATCHAHTSWVYSVCCNDKFTHADGSVSALLASCSRDQSVRIWVDKPVAEGEVLGRRGEGSEMWRELFVLEAHEDWAAHVKMTHCGRRLLSSGNDGKIVLWCLHEGVLLRSFNMSSHDTGLWWLELHDR